MTITEPSDHLDIIACGEYYLNPDLFSTSIELNETNEQQQQQQKIKYIYKYFSKLLTYSCLH